MSEGPRTERYARRYVLALVCWLGLLTAALVQTPAARAQGASVPGDDALADHAAALLPHSTLHLPPDAMLQAQLRTGFGVPVMIYLHGCRRFDEHEQMWARFLTQSGIAMLAIDSFGPRGISGIEQRLSVCTGLRLIGRDRSLDALSALYMVHNDIGVPPGMLDTARVGVIGFSHGAWTVMDLMTQFTLGQPPRGVDAASLPARAPTIADVSTLVLVYPWCRTLSLTQQVESWSLVPPTLFVRPTVDNVVGTMGCDNDITRLTAAAALRGQGPVQDRIVDADGHAFDEPGGAFVPFDPHATQQAAQAVVRFLAATL